MREALAEGPAGYARLARAISEAQFAGEEIAIGFNSRYVLDTLGAQAGEQVLIELKDGLSPGVFKSFEDEGTLCVIMPMRI